MGSSNVEGLADDEGFGVLDKDERADKTSASLRACAEKTPVLKAGFGLLAIRVIKLRAIAGGGLVLLSANSVMSTIKLGATVRGNMKWATAAGRNRSWPASASYLARPAT